MSEPTRDTRRGRVLVSALAVGLLGAALVAGPALAGKPSGGGGNTSTTVQLVLVNSTDATANHGDQVTFKVSSSYAYPVVSVTCQQAGTTVYGDSRPMYWPNAFNDPGIFTLSSLAWTGGAADCTASVRVSKKNGVTTVGSSSFQVEA